MKFSNKISFSLERDGKLCEMVCDQDASLGFVFDAICEFRHLVLEKMKQSEEKEEVKEENKDESSSVSE